MFETASTIVGLGAEAVHFDFASEAVADSFEVQFTLDHFFGSVADLNEFQALTYSAESPGRRFDVTLNSDRTFSLTALLPGDYNENGVVDAADYTVWRDRLGQSESLPNDDTVGVGPDDYTRWVNNFGQTSGSGSGIGSNATVPEPKSAVICLMGGILLAGRVGRRYNRFLAFAASRGE
jgi:hypothetical protein